eukprot:gb/GECG01016099.1/.p1 GENE.gb/GECG01016099.1/~~gb/GECG01016099.1/.p1  ORF type:complete len:1432 (+),score=227.60 gb/GECG01016099.1/:1-4296(+)
MPPKGRPSSKGSKGKDAESGEEDNVANEPSNIFVASNQEWLGDMEPKEGEELFSMRVLLKHIWLQRSDEAEEDDFKTWAHVQIATLDENYVKSSEEIDQMLQQHLLPTMSQTSDTPLFHRNNRLWYAFGENSTLSKTSVTNGMEASYNYDRRSKRVSLSSKVIEELNRSRVEVVFYKGAERNSEKDTPIAVLCVPLGSVSRGDSIRRKYNLQPLVRDQSGTLTIMREEENKVNEGKSEDDDAKDSKSGSSPYYFGAATLEIRPDSCIQNLFCGGRFVEFGGVSVSGVPHQWRTPQPSSYVEDLLDAEEEIEEDVSGLTSVEGRIKGSSDHIALTGDQNEERFKAPVRSGDENDQPDEVVELTDEEADSLVKRSQNDEGYSYRYTLQLLLPQNGGNNPKEYMPGVTLPSSLQEIQDIQNCTFVTLTNGYLTLEELDQDTQEAESDRRRYRWKIRWPVHRKFITEYYVKQLRNVLRNGWPLRFVIHRLYTETVEPENRWPLYPPIDGDTGHLLSEIFQRDAGSLSSEVAANGVSRLQEMFDFKDPLLGLTNARILCDDFLGRGCGEISINGLLENRCTPEVETNIKPLYLSRALLKLESQKRQVWEEAWDRYTELLNDRVAAVDSKLSEVGSEKGGKGAKPKGKGGKDKKQTKPKPKGKEKDKKKAGKGGKQDAPEETTATPLPFYTALNSILTCGVCLNKPLQEAKPVPPPPELAPSDIVTPRDTPPKGPLATAPSESFRKDILLSVNAIAEQYCNALQTVMDKEGGAGNRETRRRELLKLLNTSGLYHSMKDRLKKSIARIIRERYGDVLGLAKDNALEDLEALDTSTKDNFVSNLYTYLIGQTYKMLNISRDVAQEGEVGENDSLSFTDPASGEPGDLVESFKESAREISQHVGDATATLLGDEENAGDEECEWDVLARDSINEGVPKDALYEYWHRLRIARDKEMCQEYSRAERELQARITITEKAAMQGRSNGQYSCHAWEDYGEFCARCFKRDHAADAFKEAVSIDSTRVSSLLCLGCIELERGNHSNGCTFLKALVRVLHGGLHPQQSSSIKSAEQRNIHDAEAISLTLQSLVGPSVNNSTSEESASLLRQAVEVKCNLSYEETAVDDYEAAVMEVYLLVAQFCSRLNCVCMQQLCVGHSEEISKDLHTDTSTRCRLLVGRAELKLRLIQRAFMASSHMDDKETKANFKDLEEAMRTTVELDSNNLRAWRYLGFLYVYGGDSKKGLEYLHQSVVDWEDTFSSIENLGFAHIEERTPELDYTQLELVETANRIARLNMCTGEASSVADAKKIFLRIAKATKFASSWCGAGEASLLLGHLVHAEAALDESSRMDSSDPVTWAVMARFWLTSSPPQMEEAAQSIDKCLNLQVLPQYPRHREALEETVKEYMRRGRFQMARSICEAVLKQVPSDTFERLVDECKARERAQ